MFPASTNTPFQSHGVKVRWILGFVLSLLWEKPGQASLLAAKKVQSLQPRRMWKQQDPNICNDNTESLKFLLITCYGGCPSKGQKPGARLLPSAEDYYWGGLRPWVISSQCSCHLGEVSTSVLKGVLDGTSQHPRVLLGNIFWVLTRFRHCLNVLHILIHSSLLILWDKYNNYTWGN